MRAAIDLRRIHILMPLQATSGMMWCDAASPGNEERVATFYRSDQTQIKRCARSHTARRRAAC